MQNMKDCCEKDPRKDWSNHDWCFCIVIEIWYILPTIVYISLSRNWIFFFHMFIVTNAIYEVTRNTLVFIFYAVHMHVVLIVSWSFYSYTMRHVFNTFTMYKRNIKYNIKWSNSKLALCLIKLMYIEHSN
jgi:hypothetical protein